jgi:hypothetical protein
VTKSQKVNAAGLHWAVGGPYQADMAGCLGGELAYTKRSFGVRQDDLDVQAKIASGSGRGTDPWLSDSLRISD